MPGQPSETKTENSGIPWRCFFCGELQNPDQPSRNTWRAVCNDCKGLSQFGANNQISEISADDLKREIGAKISVPQHLRNAASIYEERNKLYGDNYKRFGSIMATLFPEGLNLKTAEDFNRFGIFVQIVSKQTRYAENFNRGGHNDSLDDSAVYAMMLKELDLESGGQK